MAQIVEPAPQRFTGAQQFARTSLGRLPCFLGDPDWLHREGPRWAGVLLMAGGLLLRAMGCPVPL